MGLDPGAARRRVQGRGAAPDERCDGDDGGFRDCLYLGNGITTFAGKKDNGGVGIINSKIALISWPNCAPGTLWGRPRRLFFGAFFVGRRCGGREKRRVCVLLEGGEEQKQKADKSITP